jgi:hypothetical protein
MSMPCSTSSRSGRVNRQIFTGNLIKAFEKYPNGKLVNYTDYQGQVRQGLMMPKGFDIQEELTKEPVAFSTPQQVMTFITELTNRRGIVKTLDELLILKTQFNGEGFVLQTPKAKESGGKYFLDEGLIAAAGSDFYSVSDRMEVVIPPERLEQTLAVLMNQRNYTLAAFESKDIARQFLGVTLPTLEKVEVEEPKIQTSPEPRITQSPASGPLVETPETGSSPDSPAKTSPTVPNRSQMGQLEKRILRFLKTAGIDQAVLETEEFHQRIENEPFIPLVVERQGDELYLTHYLTQNGDMFIDAEMMFTVLPEGQLQFKETAVQDPRGGESRIPDRQFAQIFSKNILKQGFAEAAKVQREQGQERAEAEAEAETPAYNYKPEIDRQDLPADIRGYMEFKDQHLDALVLVQTSDQRFYETFFEDAQQMGQALELILTSKESGIPEVGRVVAAGFPVKSLEKYLEPLREKGPLVLVDRDGLPVVYSQQVAEVLEASATSPQETESTPEPVQEADSPDVEEPEFRVQNLFDLEQFSSSPHNGHHAPSGTDSAWKPATEPKQVSPPTEQPKARPVKPSIPKAPAPTLQEIADEVREADLEAVAANLGLELDRHDKYKWRDGDHIISISGPLFMDWLADKGGRGAIDLVMHVQEVEFKEAVEWLSGRDLSHRPANVGTYAYAEDREPRSLEMPEANEIRWDAVREYLVETRKLPAVLVDRLHERGLVFADDHQNAVFVRHSLTNNTWVRGEVTGASLRGTWGEDNHYHGLAPGSARDQGWFWIGTGTGPVRRVLLTESPIDAMSLALLDKERRVQPGVTIYLSTDGSGGFPVEGLKPILQNGGRVVAAFDADQAGELMAWRLAQQLPGVERLAPGQSKDWNEQLMHPEQSGKVVQPTANQAQMNQLWQWHLAATKLRRPEAYLNRITEVGKEVVKGVPLSEKAAAAMARDMTQLAQTLGKPRPVPKPAHSVEIER